MAPKNSTTEKRIIRLDAIHALIAGIPARTDSAEYDEDDRGVAFGYRKFARKLGNVLANIEQSPKEKLAAITRAVSAIPTEFTTDPNDWEATEFSNGVERGEILLAKHVRQILNSPVTT